MPTTDPTTTLIIQASIALAFAIVLALWLGRMYRPRPGGLTETDTREVLVLIGFSTVVLMEALGRVPSAWLQNITLVMVGFFFGNNYATRKTAAIEPQAERPAATPPTAGFAHGPLLGLVALASIVALTGCATILRPIQKGVDKAANTLGGQKAVDAVHSFRNAEGAIFVDENGYIATSNLTATVAIYAVDEARWITGRVQAVETFTRYNTPIGPAPAAPSAPTPPQTPPPQTGTPPGLPSAGPSIAPLSGPTTGGVAL